MSEMQICFCFLDQLKHTETSYEVGGLDPSISSIYTGCISPYEREGFSSVPALSSILSCCNPHQPLEAACQGTKQAVKVERKVVSKWLGSKT